MMTSSDYAAQRVAGAGHAMRSNPCELVACDRCHVLRQPRNMALLRTANGVVHVCRRCPTRENA